MASPAEAVLARYLAGDLPANVALMQLLVEARSSREAAALVEARRSLAAEPDRIRLAALLGLMRAHPEAWRTVRSVMAEADHAAVAPADWSEVFDRLARASPEAGVALYALGDPDLLGAATAEVAARLREWGLTGPGRRLLELGCGYGRLSLALADDFAEILGLDVSGEMIAEARRRAAGRPHLRFARTAGGDLAGVASGSVDTLLAADVFPYLVSAGSAPRHVAEAARVLSPGGALVILNYSYRGDDARDRAEAASAFAASGLTLERDGTRDCALWDARTFLGRKSGPSSEAGPG